MVRNDTIPLPAIVERAIEIVGGDVSKLAQILGVSVPAIYAWRNGTRNAKPKTIDALYDFISKNRIYGEVSNAGRVIVLADSTSRVQMNDPEGVTTQFIFVPLFHSQLGITTDTYAFRKSWLERITHNNEQRAFMYRNVGLQMKPIFSSEALLLINPCERELIHKKIYLIGVGDQVYVRRFFASQNNYVFNVENEEFALQNFIFTTTDEFTLLGTVIWFANEL